MQLDHIAYAADPQGLGATVQRLGRLIGAAFVDGGLHPRFGTRNFVLPLAGGTYLEVVGALDHPAADAAPFGQAVKRRTAAGGGWLAWVLAVSEIAPVERRLGRQAVNGYRRRPDGVELRWKQIGVKDLLDDPALPFFVQWQVGSELHPSRNPGSPVWIERLEIAGDADAVTAWLGEPASSALGGVEICWVDAEEPGLTAVTLRTTYGSVRIE